MFCKNCGAKIDDDARFCPTCGAEIKSDERPSMSTGVGEVAFEKAEDKPPKVWTVFALVSKILGIVCLVASFIPYVNYFSLSFGIIGIVMACLGRKAKNAEADKNCSIGLKLSIAAVVVSVVLAIFYTVLFTVLLAETANYYA